MVFSGSKSKLDGRISSPIPNTDGSSGSATSIKVDVKHHVAEPSLYVTPEPTPVPDSPSSFAPSPYIVNHKRRGKCLLKSFSNDDVSSQKKGLDEKAMFANATDTQKIIGHAMGDVLISREVVDSSKENNVAFTSPDAFKECNRNDIHDGERGPCEPRSCVPVQNVSLKSVTFDMERDGDVGNSYDPQTSVTPKITFEIENMARTERSYNLATPSAEFYDAREDLTSESGSHPRERDVEVELNEIRSNLLTEIEKRKQAGEAQLNIRSQWLGIREHLYVIGLCLPEDPFSNVGDEQLNDLADEVCMQVYVCQLVSNAIGREVARAEVESDVEVQIDAKNVEVSHLLNRLQFYEALNQEISQRNQEAVETARRLRQARKKRRQRWVLWSAAAAVSVGTAVLVSSYLGSGKGSPYHHASEGDYLTK